MYSFLSKDIHNRVLCCDSLGWSFLCGCYCIPHRLLQVANGHGLGYSVLTHSGPEKDQCLLVLKPPPCTLLGIHRHAMQTMAPGVHKRCGSQLKGCTVCATDATGGIIGMESGSNHFDYPTSSPSRPCTILHRCAGASMATREDRCHSIHGYWCLCDIIPPLHHSGSLHTILLCDFTPFTCPFTPSMSL